MKNLPEIWNEFVNAGDVDSVCSLYEEDARLLATFASSPIDSPEGIRGYFEGFTARSGAVCNSMKREHSGSILLVNAIFTQGLTVSFTERVTISSFFLPATPFWLMKKVILKFFTTTHLSFLIPESFTPNILTHHHAQPKGNLRYLLFGSPQGSS